MQQLAPVGGSMIEHSGVGDGTRHLDIASGTGEPGLAVARRWPGSHVVLTDLVPEMLHIATQRAEADGLSNVETVVCSADALPFDDDSFDTISVRFGYMFFPDVAKVTAELRRVLVPGGRLCAAVWTRPDENPWINVIMDAIQAEAPTPPPAPDAPGIFRFAAPGAIGSLFSDAGLGDIAEWDVGVELVAESPEEYWEMMGEHVSPAAVALAGMDDAARQRVRARTIAGLQPFSGTGVVRVPGVARCIVATKEAVAMTDDGRAIRAIPAAFAAAWNIHDAAALSTPFHPDADFTNVFGMRASGREAVERFHAPIFETMFRDSQLVVDDVSMRMLRPDVVMVDVRWTMSGATSPMGEPWPDRRGLMDLVCTKEHGAWGIAVMHNTDLPDEALADAQASLQGDDAPEGVSGP